MGHYTYSLYSLKVQYPQDILNKHTNKLLQKKLVRVFIYLGSVFFIAISYVYRYVDIINNITDENNEETILHEDIVVFVNNISVLSLLTLILYYERPSFHIKHPYSECMQCKYLTSQKCAVCGESLKNQHVNEQSVQDENKSAVQLLTVPSRTISNSSINTGYSKQLEKGTKEYDAEKCDGVSRVADCALFKKIYEISSSKTKLINTFYEEYTAVVDLENEFNHIIDAHNGQGSNEQCLCNQHNDIDTHVNKSADDGNMKKAYIIQLVANIHSYLYHKHETRRGLTPKSIITDVFDHEDNKYDEEEEKKEDNVNAFVDNTLSYIFEFGLFIYYELLRQNKYESFKEEMTQQNHIDMDTWNQMYAAAKTKAETEKAKECIAKYNHNNMLKIQQIQIADILAIKLYTDLDELQHEFRQSFSRKHGETDTDVIKRHISKYYFWGKWLHHAITVYGDKINNKLKINNKKVAYYHGLSTELCFDSLRHDFNIPMSVTTNQIKAGQFATDKGIILELKCQWDYESKWNRTKAFSVKWISEYPLEEEVLLFGNFNQLMIANIILMRDQKNNKQHKLIIQTINNFEMLCNGMNLDDEYDENNPMHNTMKMLIENEFHGQQNHDYFAKLFHNICEKREKFIVQKFVEKKKQRVFEVLTNDDDVYCWDEECKQPIERYDYNGYVGNLHCVVCRKR
eukprot:227692_1